MNRFLLIICSLSLLNACGKHTPSRNTEQPSSSYRRFTLKSIRFSEPTNSRMVVKNNQTILEQSYQITVPVENVQAYPIRIDLSPISIQGDFYDKVTFHPESLKIIINNCSYHEVKIKFFDASFFRTIDNEMLISSSSKSISTQIQAPHEQEFELFLNSPAMRDEGAPSSSICDSMNFSFTLEMEKSL